MTLCSVENVALLRWGLIPSWAKDPVIGYRTINARAETVATAPSFRAAFKARRCIVPASGFYECRPISTRVNSPKNDDPSILEHDGSATE